MKPSGQCASRIVYLLCIVLVLGIAAGMGVPVCAGADGNSGETSEYQGTHTIMHFTKEQLDQIQNAIDTAPTYSAPARRLLRSSPARSVTLLPYLPYIPSERDQGNCGNCWIWASNGALEIEHNVNNGIHDRLSIQYVNSKYQYNTGIYACFGGYVQNFTAFYNQDKSPIPWTNTNASYRDYHPNPDGSTAVPFRSIATSPSYSLNSLSNSTIVTFGVGNSTAITNIRAALDANHPVLYFFYLPLAGFMDFTDFWGYGSNTSMFDPSPYSGQELAGGHGVIIVGYNTTDPDNPYWLAVNSWGAPTNRTDGTYRLNMTMNYDGVAYESGTPLQQNSFQILTSVFTDTSAVPVVSSVSPGSGMAVGGTAVTITGMGFTGTTNVTFGSTPATSYTFSTADTDSQMTAIAPAGNAGPVHITVTNAYGTSTPSPADQYTYTEPPLDGGSDNGPAAPAAPAVRQSATTEVNVGGNSAVSRVDVTGTGIADLIVTGTVPSALPAGVSPAPGSIYEYISLVPARYTTITGATITFTVPDSYLAEHHLSPQDIVMYHYTGTGWTALPTTVGSTAQGEVTFTSTSTGFSLYAISALPGTGGNKTAVLSGTTIGDPVTTSPAVTVSPEISLPVTPAPAVQQTTVAPASQPASVFSPATIAIVGVVVLVLIGSGFLILRWWRRRQNPALFR
ncbi:PGF-pre-PGF domain-containing protein [Methanoregula sp.]|uniref:PGF-pre-PGF domain-containing protein n=1 Tax=Methanoregula sp. TaxID=2052170 RepID=UPI0035621498